MVNVILWFDITLHVPFQSYRCECVACCKYYSSFKVMFKKYTLQLQSKRLLHLEIKSILSI